MVKRADPTAAELAVNTSGMVSPKYDGELPEDVGEIDLGMVLKAFAGMKTWALEFAEFVDGLADVLQRCDARLAMYPDVTGLREQVAAMGQQIAGLAGRINAPVPGAAVLTNAKPEGSVDAFLYHPEHKARRVRTQQQKDDALRNGYHVELADAARVLASAKQMSQYDAGLAIQARGAEEDTRRPAPLVPPGAQTAQGPQNGQQGAAA